MVAFRRALYTTVAVPSRLRCSEISQTALDGCGVGNVDCRGRRNSRSPLLRPPLCYPRLAVAARCS